MVIFLSKSRLDGQTFKVLRIAEYFNDILRYRIVDFSRPHIQIICYFFNFLQVCEMVRNVLQHADIGITL